MNFKNKLIVVSLFSLIVLIGSLFFGASIGIAFIIALVLGILLMVLTDPKVLDWDKDRVRNIREKQKKEVQIRDYERGIKRRSYLEERGRQEAKSGFVGREERRAYDNPSEFHSEIFGFGQPPRRWRKRKNERSLD